MANFYTCPFTGLRAEAQSTVPEEVLRELKRYPAPQFQALRLTDLPIEVPDNIVNLASTAQSKALSCSCHILDDIGQRHIPGELVSESLR
jgi:hypothetical protein